MFGRAVFAAALTLGAGAACAQEVKISSVSVSRLGKANLCSALGGGEQAPVITIRHTRGTGSISIAMVDRLSNGRTNDHGSSQVQAEPTGTTIVRNNFRPPCNRITSQGVKSAYYVTATSGQSSKTVLWGRYP
ncbi:hypothetical protein [Bradyrhizobium pachyrhizi]|uniref:hypothetical protein n=1 Tax=Bradyrhizobium pachyrhizi TaxID=280333 RepID=UPI00067BE434|nr:hypothetical protein [Bradyrhizobium pachyrhizi]